MRTNGFARLSGKAARALVALLLVSGSVLWATPSVAGEWGLTDLVSVSATDGPADDSSSRPAISDDGSRVAFESYADNLVDTPLPGSNGQVFVRDLASGETTLASVSSTGTPGNGDFWEETAISGDGNVVAFNTNATNLGEIHDPGSNWRNVFVRNLQTGETTLANLSAGGVPGDADHYYPSLSHDGSMVAFESDSDNLVREDDKEVWDVFLRHLKKETTDLISVSTTGTPGNGHSWDPDVSDDAHYVAFYSGADNLVEGDSNGEDDVFVRDTWSETTVLASVSTTGLAGDGMSYSPSISGDGTVVAFESEAENLVPGDTNESRDIFVRSLVTSTTVRVSVSSSGEQGDDDSGRPVLSGDGRFVAFQSTAANLVAGDTNDKPDVFVHDLVTGDTWRASVANSGLEADGNSVHAGLSSDGSAVVFSSAATNLVFGDTNDEWDIFVRRYGEGETYVPIAGADRYKTAIEASRQTFAAGSVETVVVATGENWPDALGGAALAGAVGGPILLTRSDSLLSEVENEIERLGATDAFILGGEAALGPAVENDLAALLGPTNVTRVGGSDRYGTADLIARAVKTWVGSAYDGTAFVATGSDFPDSLAAGPLASSAIWPVFLTAPTGLRPSTASAMSDIGVSDAIILGGTSAVAPDVEAALKTALGEENVVRLAGSNRFDTAKKTAEHGTRELALAWDGLALATGMSFPDGLAGGVIQGQNRSVLLLTKSAELSSEPRAAITANKSFISTVRYLGGTNAISQTVRTEVANILQ